MYNETCNPPVWDSWYRIIYHYLAGTCRLFEWNLTWPPKTIPLGKHSAILDNFLLWVNWKCSMLERLSYRGTLSLISIIEDIVHHEDYSIAVQVLWLCLRFFRNFFCRSLNLYGSQSEQYSLGLPFWPSGTWGSNSPHLLHCGSSCESCCSAFWSLSSLSCSHCMIAITVCKSERSKKLS